MAALSSQQVAQFQTDGFLPRLRALDAEQAQFYRTQLEAFECNQGSLLTAMHLHYSYKLHLLFGWADALVRHPLLLDAVQALLGPDLLVYTTKFFIKEPKSEAITAWHQDATHFGFASPASVAVWLAFSDAGLDKGCLEYVPGSHKLGQLQHRSNAEPSSINGGNQALVDSFSDAAAKPVPMQAGEFSLHHSLCIHRSRQNQGTDRRIGFSIHYVSPAIAHLGSRKVTALLVRGEDRHGYYEQEQPPQQDFDAQAQAHHAQAVQRYRKNYKEQEVCHARGL